MKPKLLLVLLLALSTLAGYLLSKASLVGRIGISLFYKEYKILKVWWQAVLFVFTVWMILFFLQRRLKRKCSSTTSRLVQIGAILIALAGLFLTYQDFRNNLSHRLLGERFHLGGYLFWFGWIIISVYYLMPDKNHRSQIQHVGSDETQAANDDGRITSR